MPPVPEVVGRRLVSLVYDGTNATDVVEHANLHYPITPESYLVGPEADGVLTITTSNPDLWSGVTVNTGDHVVASTAGVEVVPDSFYAERFVVLD